MNMVTKIGNFFVIVGILEIISAILVYPEIAQYWRNNNIVNYYNDMVYYTIFATFTGLITMIIGIVFRKTKNDSIINISILIFVISVVFLSDRLLLAKYGSGLWKYDKVLHFVHRPNSTFRWGEEYDNKLIKINSFGYHDDEFIKKKEPDEKRIFLLGNSIAMGHGVSNDETFANQLETLYHNCKVKVLNFGVQGYVTMQELEVLKRNLDLQPDVIIDGFCLNDITEPVHVNKNYGGKGYDYHQVFQIRNEVLGYIFNETGFGRLVSRLKFADEIKNSKPNELEAVNSLSINPFFDDEISNSWSRNLQSLIKMKEISDSLNNIFIVLIFPYTFQLFDETLKNPQNYLKENLDLHSISYLDFTEVFERIIKNDNEIDLQQRVDRYYLDEDHFTTLGHKVVASELKLALKNDYNFESQSK